MQLPKNSRYKTIKQVEHSKPKKQIWIAILAIIAIVISLLSAGFSAFVYFNTPLQIHNYVQTHKDELKGKDGHNGLNGRDGSNGRNGMNSHSPTHCSTYDYSFGSSTSCY